MAKSEEKISKVTMKPFAECQRAVDRDWYHIDFDVEFYPSFFYPDYTAVTGCIKEEVSGKVLNIEEAVDKVGELFSKYEPQKLVVRGVVSESTSHFSVEVVKEF